MASAHTTPEKSLASAYAHSQRAQAGRESRMKKDPCYELYAAALKCESRLCEPMRPCREAAGRCRRWRVESPGCRATPSTQPALNPTVPSDTGLDENNYAHEQCADAFQAFRACRTAQVREQRQLAGGDKRLLGVGVRFPQTQALVDLPRHNHTTPHACNTNTGGGGLSHADESSGG
jgi:hypothetical protein